MLLVERPPDSRLVEIIELPNHPFFIATQFHPEFQSRPNSPHPLFLGLIQAAGGVEAHRLQNPLPTQHNPVETESILSSAAEVS
jgi:CTP synthase